MAGFQEMIVPLFSFILLVFFLHKWRSGAASTPRKRLPPSPRKLPIFGNLHQLGIYHHQSLHSLAKRYGQLMLLHFGRTPVLVVSSAVAAREIMKNQDLIFANRPKLSVPDRLTYGSRNVVWAPYGDYWRQVRSICMLQLLNNKRVQSFRRVREEETSLMVEKIRQLGSSSSSVVNLSDLLMSLSNDVLCRVALGRKYGNDGKGKMFKENLREYEELLGVSPFWEYIPWLAWTNRFDGLDVKIKKITKFFDELFQSVLEEHRDRNKREKVRDEAGLDFVDILLEFQRENKGGSPVEDDVVKAVILDMFAGGTDTTSTALEWTIAELMRTPRTMKVLQNEVRQVAGSKEEIDEDDLEKMPYLKAAIKEGLRMHPPAPLLVPRESTQDTKVLGYDIASKTRVLINAYATGRDPSSWENPDEFRPERFLDSSIDFNGFHFELIPFGAGRRGCPGIAFGVAVEELALAKLVHKFDFALPNGGKEKDLDMREAPGITVHKLSPLLLVATSRA